MRARGVLKHNNHCVHDNLACGSNDRGNRGYHRCANHCSYDRGTHDCSARYHDHRGSSGLGCRCTGQVFRRRCHARD